MRIGYARTSTLDQIAGFEAQIKKLMDEGCEKIFQEQLSSVDARRPQLEAMIDFARDGDVVICTKLDRLARSVSDVVAIEARLKKKGAMLHIMDPAVDTKSPAGRLVFNVIASIAQFEREIMLERQREGIAKAKTEGKYKGRQPTARAKTDEVLELAAQGKGASYIARTLGIGRSSVHRAMKSKPANGKAV
jgi:DNA invertase Pin-like site-specific DNA recombinase